MKGLLVLCLMNLFLSLEGYEFTYYHSLKAFSTQGEIVFSNDQV